MKGNIFYPSSNRRLIAKIYEDSKTMNTLTQSTHSYSYRRYLQIHAITHPYIYSRPQPDYTNIRRHTHTFIETEPVFHNTPTQSQTQIDTHSQCSHTCSHTFSDTILMHTLVCLSHTQTFSHSHLHTHRHSYTDMAACILTITQILLNIYFHPLTCRNTIVKIASLER